jgi:hypothetical protein
MLNVMSSSREHPSLGVREAISNNGLQQPMHRHVLSRRRHEGVLTQYDDGIIPRELVTE